MPAASEQESNRLDTHAAYFDPLAPLTITEANLPHWSQDNVTYFVTFRLTDSLPSEKLRQWMEARDLWLQNKSGSGVSPLVPNSGKQQDSISTRLALLSPSDQAEYHRRFSATIEDWLDQGIGSCVLEIPECRTIVENALRHFDGQRYMLVEHVVAINHVHVLVTLPPNHALAEILHSWKSFTAKEIIKVEAASRRLSPWWNLLASRRQNTATPPSTQRPVWQKESFDHIVRSPASLHKFVAYIRNH
jgi:type I restriction enzyme R subunit